MLLSRLIIALILNYRMLLWLFQQRGTSTVVLVSLTVVLGFIPTFRKASTKPQQETTQTFGLNCTKYMIALLALDHLAFKTVLYPTTVVLMNIGFVLLLVI